MTKVFKMLQENDHPWNAPHNSLVSLNQIT